MSGKRSEYSLWLLPGADGQQRLTALIARLANRFATQPFIPHVTIQGDLMMPLAAVSRVAESIAKDRPAQRWRVAAVEGSEHFFRSLYLRFDETTAYTGCKKVMQEASGTADGLSLFPHLSLAYGLSDEQGKRDVIAELSAMIGNEIRFDRVVVARSSSHVPIAEWACLAEFPFAKANDSSAEGHRKSRRAAY